MNIDAAELDKNSPHYIHNLFMRNAMLWDLPTEQWAMSEEDFIKAIEQFKAEQKQSAGVWIKASKRLPEQKRQVCGKLNGKPAIVWNSNLTEGYITANGNLERIDDVEWLDETPLKQTV